MALKGRQLVEDLVEYGCELVVVPRICDLCQQHRAFFFYTRGYPWTYVCECCWAWWGPLADAAVEHTETESRPRGGRG